MSHITIIISKAAPPVATEQEATAVSYEYCIPVPDGTPPSQVGEIVRKAYKKLEGWDSQAEA